MLWPGDAVCVCCMDVNHDMPIPGWNQLAGPRCHMIQKYSKQNLAECHRARALNRKDMENMQ